MLKFLIILALIWLLARLAKRWILAKAMRMQHDLLAQMQAQMSGQISGRMPGEMPGQTPPSAGAERMVACAHCGLLFPQARRWCLVLPRKPIRPVQALRLPSTSGAGPKAARRRPQGWIGRRHRPRLLGKWVVIRRTSPAIVA